VMLNMTPHTPLLGGARHGTHEFTRSLRHHRPPSPRRTASPTSRRPSSRPASPRRATSPREERRKASSEHEEADVAHASAQMALSVLTEGEMRAAADAPGGGGVRSGAAQEGLDISRRDRSLP
jgi:hypothetical protein